VCSSDLFDDSEKGEVTSAEFISSLIGSENFKINLERVESMLPIMD
jgi:Ca2+-binding EF-hand superfamily protein